MAAPKEERVIPVIIVLDFETGGLDCRKHAITQIAMQAVRIDTWEVIGKYQSYVKPYSKLNEAKKKGKLTPKNKTIEIQFDEGGSTNMEYTEKALEYSHISLDNLKKNGQDIMTVARESLDFIKDHTLSSGHQGKPVIVGQNIPFDIGFFQQLMTYGGKEMVDEYKDAVAGQKDYYGNFQPRYMDTIDIAKLALAHDQNVTSYKLELMCERLGIEIDDAHDADADVTATLNVVIMCSNKMRYGGEVEGAVSGIKKIEKSRIHFKI